MTGEWKRIADRMDRLLERFERLLPPATGEPDWKATAFRWRKHARGGYLEAVRHPHRIRLDDLQCVGEQKRACEQNTRQFVGGKSANNVLLTGARGTGKSLADQGGAARIRRQGPAIDRGGQARPRRPARDRGPDRRTAGALRRLLRRPFVRGRRAGLQVAQVRARRLDRRRARQPADLRHLEPPPPDARIDGREPPDRRAPTTARSIPAKPPKKRCRCRNASASGSPSTRSTRSIPGHRRPLGGRARRQGR